MEDFLAEMADILDEDAVAAEDALATFESWDSLAVLSVAALADASFGVTLSSREIRDAATVGDLYQRIVTKSAA